MWESGCELDICKHRAKNKSHSLHDLGTKPQPVLGEAQFALTCFCCTVNVFNGEDSAQAIEKHFSQSWYKLSCGDQHIDTVGPRKQKLLEIWVSLMTERW